MSAIGEGNNAMGKLQEWSAKEKSWVGDALRRAALAGIATAADAGEIAARVQAANGIIAAGNPECIAFDEECLVPTGVSADVELLCSIGPLSQVDRLADGQELKFALDGLTIIFGENGSGKSGYARAARRLCTSRVPITLQGNVFTTAGAPPTVAFKVKTGEDEPVPHFWSEGTPLPNCCRQMSFLDTANARAYVEDKTEILFLPPEVRCLTTLGQLYVLAGELCQAKADSLLGTYGGALGMQFSPATKSGTLVALLTSSTPLAKLPSVDQLRSEPAWDDTAAAQLAEIRVQLAEGPASQARTLRRLGTAAKAITDKGIAAMSALGKQQLDHDIELLGALARARQAAETFAAEQEGRFPIAATGSDTWRQLFLIARKFAAEAELVPEDGAFAVGDPCLLCQRPLDEASSVRMNAFDEFVAGEAAAAVFSAQANIDTRINLLQALDLETADQILFALAEHRARDEPLRVAVEGAASASQALLVRRNLMVAHLKGGTPVEGLPGIAPIVQLSHVANDLIAQADLLAGGGGTDAAILAAELELRDRETLAGCIDMIVSRRNGLADRQRYIACVAALGTRQISILASSLRRDLVTPELRTRVEREIKALGVDHVPLRFTEQSTSGKSFFEMALDTVDKAKKVTVLSEGEQRALAIACFLADAHVTASSGAIIVDDPVTSLDHQRVRRVANRFAEEAGRGRQVIIFTHNLLFYQEVLRSCADRSPQVPALPCLIQQSSDGFGIVSINDRPWIAKKIKDRQRALAIQVENFPADSTLEGEKMRVLAKQFYTDLRETWERAVEEIVLGGVVERFGTDVKTQSLKLVDIDDEDYRTIFFAMKRASERSGHDQPAGKQIDAPSKNQIEADLLELSKFITAHRGKSKLAETRRKELEQPPKAMFA